MSISKVSQFFGVIAGSHANELVDFESSYLNFSFILIKKLHESITMQTYVNIM